MLEAKCVRKTTGEQPPLPSSPKLSIMRILLASKRLFLIKSCRTQVHGLKLKFIILAPAEPNLPILRQAQRPKEPCVCVLYCFKTHCAQLNELDVPEEKGERWGGEERENDSKESVSK